MRGWRRKRYIVRRGVPRPDTLTCIDAPLYVITIYIYMISFFLWLYLFHGRALRCHSLARVTPRSSKMGYRGEFEYWNTVVTPQNFENTVPLIFHFPKFF